MIEGDAFAFNAAVRTMTTPSDCTMLFRRAIAPHGFDTFACGEVDLNNRERSVFYILDWPDNWRRFYATSGLIDRDPVVDALATRRTPFTWTDLRTDRKLAKAGREAVDLVAAAGWTEGLIVPLPNTGGRVGLVSMAGHRLVTDERLLSYLTLISICLHSHVRTLVAREGFAVPPAGLTDREIESLRLVARGLSDGAIAASLGVATSTAHEFVEKAKRRLKAHSRAELVAVATALGIIDI